MLFETCSTSNSTLTNHLASIFIACEWFWVASVALVTVIVLHHVASSAAKVIVDTQLADGTCIQRFALAVRHYVHRRRTVTQSILHRVYLLVPNRLTPPPTPRTEAHGDPVRVRHAPIVEGGGELRNAADAATSVPPRAGNNAVIEMPEDEAPEMIVHGVPLQMRYPIPVQLPLPLTQDQGRLMRCPDVVMLLMNALEEELRQQEYLCLVYPHLHNLRGGGAITFLFTVTMRYGGDSLLRLERIKCLLTHCEQTPRTIVLPRNIACTEQAFKAIAVQCLVSVVHVVLFDDASPIHHNPGAGTAVVVGSPSAISLLIEAIDACSNPLAAPT
jgi:hypothetical protein